MGLLDKPAPRRGLFRLAGIGIAAAAVAPAVQRVGGVVPKAASTVRASWHVIRFDGMLLHIPKGARITQRLYLSDGRQAIEYQVRLGKLSGTAVRWATDANSERAMKFVQQQINSMFGHLP